VKKFIFAVLLFLLVLPAFSQEDEYAKFQGVWWLQETEYSDLIHFIFINNTLIMTEEKINRYCIYSIENDTIAIKLKIVFTENNWRSELSNDWDMSDGITKFQYVFSGSKLILLSDGQPLVFSKVAD
jgi:hypothetical protein